jgi:hypothetical protein
VNKRIAFKISDTLSGIDTYKGTLNGKFILFEYDYKTHSLVSEYDAKRMKRGEQTLRLEVTDKAGNRAAYSRKGVW